MKGISCSRCKPRRRELARGHHSSLPFVSRMKKNQAIHAAFSAAAALALCASVLPLPAAAGTRWSAEQANAWQARQPWLVGCNYGPATAINQLEMWQADTFDPATIDRELALAEDLGFTSLRIFLHDLAWKQDREGFKQRVGKFLEIADRHHLGVMVVIFDAVWDPFPKAGRQREPKPHVHNSGWVQSPGADILKDAKRQDELKPYVQDILRHFARDRRVQIWDLFNEVDNPNRSAYGRVELPDKAERGLELLKKTFLWAREVNPSQPLTTGIWGDGGALKNPSPLTRYLLEEVDVITFHNYAPLGDLQEEVVALKKLGRPVLCTEYMARPVGSTFDPILGYLKAERVGAYNWGFVAGKTQTHYPWDSWTKTYTAEPPVWFHEIFRRDGTPYRAEEVRYIKQVTGKLAR